MWQENKQLKLVAEIAVRSKAKTVITQELMLVKSVSAGRWFQIFLQYGYKRNIYEFR